jgi:transcriptional regulator with XRE-family HTH domain
VASKQTVQNAEYRHHFGMNFRYARTLLKLKQSDACRLIGISEWQLSAIENGRRNVGIDTMAQMAKVVNQPLWQLFKPPGFR